MRRFVSLSSWPAPNLAMTLPGYYFQQIHESLLAAQRAWPEPVDFFFSLAGARVRLRFYTPALMPPMTEAFSHLQTEPGRAELTISVWDGSRGGQTIPPPPELSDKHRFHRYFNDGRFRVACKLYPNRINAFDRVEKEAMYWIDEAGQLPWWEYAAPLRTIFSWWASPRGMHLIHAGAVGREGGGVLLGGRGGTGKSWAAVSCLGSDLLYAGDDYCLVGEDAAPRAHSVYGMAKLKGSEDLKVFPDLEPLVANGRLRDPEKVVVRVAAARAGQMIAHFPVKAVLLPRVVANGDAALEETSPENAMRVIFSSSARQSFGLGVGDFYSFFRFMRKLPCYVFRTGTDPREMPGVISDLLNKIS